MGNLEATNINSDFSNGCWQVATENLSNPAITLVGKVAGLDQDQKSWFERQPFVRNQGLLARSSAKEGESGYETFNILGGRSISISPLDVSKS